MGRDDFEIPTLYCIPVDYIVLDKLLVLKPNMVKGVLIIL